MEPLGINTGLLLIQLLVAAVMLGLPIISLWLLQSRLTKPYFCTRNTRMARFLP
jgi:hypothetical protein